VSELKRHTRRYLKHLRKARRPVRSSLMAARCRLIDAKTYEKQMKALNLARLLAKGEEDISAGACDPPVLFYGSLSMPTRFAVNFPERKKPILKRFGGSLPQTARRCQ